MAERTWTKRAVGLGAAALFVTAVNAPGATATVMGLATTGLVVHKVRRHRGDRFTRTSIRPAVTALQRALGNGVRVELRVDRDMGNLAPRLLRDASPAEMALRNWYGRRVEPVIQWPGVQAGRARNRLVAPLRPALDYVRRPRKARGPSIRLTIHDPYLAPDQRSAIAGIIASKIPVADTTVQWDTVGESYRATWTLRRRPPRGVSLADIAAAIDKAAEPEYVLGLGAGDSVVSISLDTDSPHILLSGRSMSGKSVTTGLIIAQALRKGCRVILLDPKGSHPALVGLPNLDYCLTAAQAHGALIKAAAESEERNILSFHQGLTEWEGQRVWVVVEEINILSAKLKDYWNEIREKSDPKLSPAISALRSLSFAGRSAKYNMLLIGQSVTANAAAGPESRENAGTRLLGKPSPNMWRMLCGGTPMPSISSVPGRWYSVVDGCVTEVQVARLRKHEIIKLATVLDSADQPCPRGQALNPDELTLVEAIGERLISGELAAVQKRLQRSANRPTPIGKRNGNTDVYKRPELIAWAVANSEKVS